MDPGSMTDREAGLQLATPPPEPFKQVRWQPEDYERFDAWRLRRDEALRHFGVI